MASAIAPVACVFDLRDGLEALPAWGAGVIAMPYTITDMQSRDSLVYEEEE
jgi:hypothetical protein